MKTVLLCFALLAASLSFAKNKDDSSGQDMTHHKAGTPIDPTYRAAATATGGKVYDMRNPQDAAEFQKDLRKPEEEERRREWKERWDISNLYKKLPGSDSTHLILYAILKWAAYAGWCFIGLGMAAKHSNRFGFALLWGLGRVALGVMFGISIFYLFLLSHWAPPDTWGWYIAIYFLVYVPIRWVEWSLMATAMKVRTYSWRLGGIGISCLADLVQIVFLGSLIPVGRFLC